MNIYEINVSFSLFVVANSEEEAREIARSSDVDAIAHEPDAISLATKIDNVLSVPPEWRDSFPYSQRGIRELTVAEWIRKENK